MILVQSHLSRIMNLPSVVVWCESKFRVWSMICFIVLSFNSRFDKYEKKWSGVNVQIS